MKTRLALLFILGLLMSLSAVWADDEVLGLTEVFYNMGTANVTQVQTEAANLRTQYANAPEEIPSYATFDGYFVPDSNNTKVAIFSDDGVNVYIDGSLVHAAKDMGQHLPSLDQSFHVLTQNWASGRSYHIRIEYSNICYTGEFDIDGCTMFAYDGGGAVYDEPPIEVSVSTSKSSITTCESVTVTATATDTDIVNGLPVSDTVDQFTWYIDGIHYSPGDNLSEITLEFSSPGSRNVSVVADEDSPQVDDSPATAFIQIGVDSNSEPPAIASAMCSLSASGPWQGSTIDIQAGTTIYFSGDCSDAPSYDNDIANDCTEVADSISAYSWDYGDTNTGSGADVNHTYTAVSQYVSLYTVSLTVDDAGTVFDDSESAPSQLRVRVFEAAPAAPTVTRPTDGELYNGLSPVIFWEGRLHDKCQVRILTVDDPNGTPIWDSGEVSSEDSQIICGSELSEQTTYYVFVREHNLIGWGAWSATGHDFTVEEPFEPENISVSWDPEGPTLFCGNPITCTVTYREQNASFGNADLLIDESSLDGIDSCYLRYDAITGQCWLADENGMLTIGGEGYIPGSTNILENNQVTIDLENTTISIDGTDLIINWRLEFKKTFSGPKSVALSITNTTQLEDPDNPEVLDTIDIVSESINSEFTSPDNCAYINSSSVTFTGIAWDYETECISAVEISTDGGETWVPATLDSGQGTRTWSYTLEDAEDGTYAIKSRATDCDDVVEEPGTGIRVTIDTAAPTSTITSPENEAVITGESVEVYGRAFDYNGKVSKVELSFDSSTWQEAALTNNGEVFNYSYPIPETADGTPLTIQSRATDAAGNVETPGDGITITITYQVEMRRGLLGDDHSTPPDIKTSLFQSQKIMDVGPYSILNLCTGYLLTTIPITGWDTVGKLAVDFKLYHQQFRPECPNVIKDKWMHSYQSVLTDSGSSVKIYHPEGYEDKWSLSGSSYIAGLDTKDTLIKDGTSGFIVTQRDHIKLYYGHSIGNQQWMLSKIEDFRANKITLGYYGAASPLLKYVKDPDGKRSLAFVWKKVGTDKHDALECIYTSWSFGSKFRQLYWLWYGEPEGNLVCIQYPHDMSQYGEGNDVPFVPQQAKTLRDDTFFNNQFSAQPTQYLSFYYQNYKNSCGDADNRIIRIGLGTNNPVDDTLVSIEYKDFDAFVGLVPSRHTDDDTTDRYSPWKSYSGCMTVTDSKGTTSISFAHSLTHWTWGDNGWYQTSSEVNTTVVLPGGSGTKGATQVYKHFDSYCSHLSELSGNNNWNGQRIWTVITTAQDVNKNTVTYGEEFNWYGNDYADSEPNLLMWYRDPNRWQSSYYWDDYKLQWSRNESTGEQTNMTYDGYDLETITDPAGKKTKYTYDTTTRELTKEQIDLDNLNITTDYDYDDKGNLETVTGPYTGSTTNAPVTIYEHKSSFGGLVSKKTDPEGRFVNTIYTGLGSKLWESQPRTSTSQYSAPTIWIYNKAGRPFYTWSSGDMETITEYNDRGRVYRITDAAGCETYNWYRSTGEPSRTRRYSNDNSEWLESWLTYDLSGNRIRTRKVDNTSTSKYSSTLIYDGLHRLLRVDAQPTLGEYYGDNAPKILYEYDNNGNLTKTTNGRGSTVKNKYDEANRIKKSTYSDGKVVEYIYYSLGGPNTGRLYQIKEGTTSSTTEIRRYDAYDGAGRLTDETRYDLNRKIHYEYDAAGKKTKVEIRNMSGAQLVRYDYYYYLDGKLKQIDYIDSSGTQTTNIEYDYRGRIWKRTYPNGTTTTYGYQKTGLTGGKESRDLVAWIVHKGPNGNVLSQRSYTYDVLGNVQTVSNRSFTTTYMYDDFGRLIDEKRTGTPNPYEYAYTYDPNGNRLIKTVVGSYISEYSNDEDSKLKTTTNPDITYHYDKDGNRSGKVIDGVTTAYGYDIDNRLISISSPATIYKYNSLGERYEATRSGTTTRFLYVDGNLLQELDTAGNVVVAYNPGIFEIKNGTIQYYEHDLQGNTVSTTNSSGSLTEERFVYGAYGENIDVYSSSRYKYGGSHGCYSDAYGTDLIKMGARYYDPTIGRFITKDPGREGANWYLYANDNPITLADPDGKSPMLVTGAMGAGFGAIGGGIYGGYTAWKDKEDIWNGVANGAVRGAVIGGVAGFTGGLAGAAVAGWVGGGVWGGIAGGAIGGAVGDICGQYTGIGLGWRSSYDPYQTIASGAIGAIAGGFSWRPTTKAEQYVSHWGGDINSVEGQYVQVGSPTKWNWTMAGRRGTFSEPTNATISSQFLRYPRGWDYFKGVFGQRIYTGSRTYTSQWE